MSGGMWPQSTLGEVVAAQKLADDGDPAYTWQLFAQSSPDEEPWRAEPLKRFIEEGLGWVEYLPRGNAYAQNGGGYFEVVVIRCAPGRTNSLASLYADMTAEIRGCAPTIDELTYETVMLSLIQPKRQGASGIWVVGEWEMRQPRPEPPPSGYYFFPDLEQVRQFVPPSDAEVNAVLDAFLQARISGEGAEQFLFPDPSWGPSSEAPLLYATTSGVPYERSSAPQLMLGPVWPTGWREYKIELVAEDETVVEQYFHVIRHGDQIGLFYGFASDHELQTTENGKAVAVLQSAFGGVTFTAPPAQTTGGGLAETIKLSGEGTDGHLILVWNPNPDSCANPREIGQEVQPANAEAVARTILALPDIQVTEPVQIGIAGTDGLQMDLTSSGRGDCLAGGSTQMLPYEYHEEWRMRLYLVDNPAFAESPDSAHGPALLAISVTSTPDDFDDVLELAAPILESIAFRSG